ncbi:MAG TPA: hypothetical protein DDW30_09540 [Clostridiales bacterium]|nr:hypothetical protein [Clostridiales bacterium]
MPRSRGTANVWSWTVSTRNTALPSTRATAPKRTWMPCGNTVPPRFTGPNSFGFLTMRTAEQTVGDYGEAVAARYLRWHGYRVIERNLHLDHHEIDLIAVRFGVIAFVEVKTRTYTEETIGILPPPRHAVNADKRRFTRRAAQKYLALHPTWRKPRMDVMEVLLSPAENGKRPRVRKIRHLTGAY